MLKTSKKGNWLELTIPEIWEGITIEDLFQKKWNSPKKLTHQFRMEQKVLVNGQTYPWNKSITAGSKLQIKLFEEEEMNLPLHYMEVTVLYEDDHVLVLNKPPFINTHPNDLTKDTNTLVNAASFYLQAKGEMRNIRQIHRLDKDTSGAILFAKHPLAGSILDRMLGNRKIKRTYIALVHGLLKQKKGEINEPIGRDRHHASRRRVSSTGQKAVTHFQVMKVDAKKRQSYVKCWLDTGRTHQIRVHLSHIGHPLVGDTLYGGKPLVNRQALHAAKLEFIHPFTEEKVICNAPFLDKPEIFKEIDVYSL
ncbi:RluA family pseudouridine synthase [Bacillus salipaludis]|uniref:Pseudouridine synthase n=1 Tax=Bacillus salipaludis TaxID=2547811 RepID=A0AA90R5R8_9BACI|nr:RluA family pseudouridine synthase [Bacillus salipaludis]MDQ6596298.1 RluA family pseudouridine synthase [Bacillus salipaludis]